MNECVFNVNIIKVFYHECARLMGGRREGWDGTERERERERKREGTRRRRIMRNETERATCCAWCARRVDRVSKEEKGIMRSKKRKRR